LEYDVDYLQNRNKRLEERVKRLAARAGGGASPASATGLSGTAKAIGRDEAVGKENLPAVPGGDRPLY